MSIVSVAPNLMRPGDVLIEGEIFTLCEGFFLHMEALLMYLQCA